MKLNIPNPCSEKWENMKPTEKGRFCLACQKEVIDFSKMNENEIKKYLKKKFKNKEGVCGRLTQKQLENLNTLSSFIYSFPKALKIGAFLSSFLLLPFFNKTVIAQEKAKQAQVSKMEDSAAEEIQANVSNGIISGYVYDEYDEPLPGITVIIKNTDVGTATDINGYFEMDISGEDKPVLFFMGVGMKNFVLPVGDKRMFNIYMKDNTQALQGGFVYSAEGYLDLNLDRVWRKFTNLFRRKENRKYY